MAVILTQAREAVWDAIDAYAPLNDKFKSKYRFREGEGGLTPIEPSFANMPALRIWPGSGTSAWILNQAQGFVYPMTFTIWTPGHSLDLPEELFQRVTEAVYQGLRSSPIGLKVASAAFGAPERLYGAGEANGKRAVRWEWVIGIQPRLWNPLATN